MSKLMNNISLTILFFLITAAAVSASPEIHFEGPVKNIGEDEMIIDIGKAEQSTIVSYEIVFVNKGSSVLKIESLEACCGRRAELLTDTETAPGEKGRILFSFSTRNRTGVVTERCIVNTNQPGREKVTVYIKVEVVPEK